MEDDGALNALAYSSLSTFLADQFGSLAGSVPADKVRALYPGLSDPQVIAGVERDIGTRWCVHFLVYNKEIICDNRTPNLNKPHKTMERCICLMWGQECVPVYLRYAHSSSIYL